MAGLIALCVSSGKVMSFFHYNGIFNNYEISQALQVIAKFAKFLTLT
jgi:hypothetical protein